MFLTARLDIAFRFHLMNFASAYGSIRIRWLSCDDADALAQLFNMYPLDQITRVQRRFGIRRRRIAEPTRRVVQVSPQIPNVHCLYRIAKRQSRISPGGTTQTSNCAHRINRLPQFNDVLSGAPWTDPALALGDTIKA